MNAIGHTINRICIICHTEHSCKWRSGPICNICYTRKYRETHKEQCLAYAREYEKVRRPVVRLRYKQQHEDVNKRYYQQHKDRIKTYNRKYEQEHRSEINKRRRERLKTDIQFKLSCYLRWRMNRAIKTGYKSGSAVRDLGCSISEFKQHLESHFQQGMSWDNYGKDEGCWSIDHIIPLTQFDLTNRDEFLQAAHYTNQRPLWHIDNLSKGAK